MAAAKTESNPNGANQWVADPRQQLFLAYYKDPKSPTFSNAKASAIRAGFTESYADNILAVQPEWLSGIMGGSSPLLVKAEKNLKDFLDLPNETQAMGAFGPIYKKVKMKVEAGKFKNGKKKFKTITEKIPVMTYNSRVMKIKQDSSHFIAETIGKKLYSKKGDEGSIMYNVVVFANEQRSRIAKRLVGRGHAGDSDGPGESH